MIISKETEKNVDIETWISNILVCFEHVYAFVRIVLQFARFGCLAIGI